MREGMERDRRRGVKQREKIGSVEGEHVPFVVLFFLFLHVDLVTSRVLAPRNQI